MKLLRSLAFTLVVTLVMAGPSLAATVHVSAAVSLKEAIDEISARFAASNPAVKVIRNYGGSGTLAQQLQNGAPVDIFISANEQWIDYLKQRKLVDSRTIATLAYNTLVFVGPPGTKASSLHDLPKLQRIAIGSPKSVPAGEYAMEALKKAGVDREMAGKLVLARDVRDCLMYAERGEVDGSLVYRTDALQARSAKILFVVPQGLYDRVTYPLALTTSGSASKGAQAFYRYLLGNESKAILGKYGFAVR